MATGRYSGNAGMHSYYDGTVATHLGTVYGSATVGTEAIQEGTAATEVSTTATQACTRISRLVQWLHRYVATTKIGRATVHFGVVATYRYSGYASRYSHFEGKYVNTYKFI